MVDKRVGRLAETLLWWGLLFGVWVVTLSAASTVELAVGAASALPCALAAVGARQAIGSSWRPSIGWVRWLGWTALAIPADTVRVLAVAANQAARRRRDERGSYERVQLEADDRPSVGRARQAIATMVVTGTPASYVTDVDVERAELVVHRLVSGPPSIEKVVSR